MKTTGIVRRIDELGRVVIPKEMCRTLYISNGDPLEFSIVGESITIKKYHPVCALCGETGEMLEFREKLICAKCLADLKKDY